MDINNNQLTNTFSGGMNTDTADVLLKEQEYRYAENIQITTNKDFGDGVVSLVDGVNLYWNCGKVYAATSIRNWAIVIISEDGGWSIYRKNLDENNDWYKIFGPCDEEISNKLSLVTRWESDQNVKLYIADGKHQIRCINILHQDYNNETPPNDAKYLGEYSNIGIPSLSVNDDNTPGNIEHHVVLYAYVLYKLGGGSTYASPLSKLKSIYDTTNNYRKGFEIGKGTGKSLRLSLYGTNIQNLDKIRIYRISYVQNGQEPIVNLIHEDNYNGNAYEFIDKGTNISEISVSEFTAFTGLKIKPQIIESKNNYLFAGNISYDQGLTDSTYDNVHIEIEGVLGEYKINEKNEILSGLYIKSLRRGETYRYGIVFYTKDGRRTSVLHITDYTVPDDSIISNVEVSATEKTCVYTVKPRFVRVYVDLTDLPDDAKNELLGYEVVRCERTINDSKNILLGIVGFPFYTGLYCIASPFMCIKKLKSPLDFNTDSSVAMFACPEHCYGDTNDVVLKLKSVGSLELEYIRECKVGLATNSGQEDDTIISPIKSIGRKLTSLFKYDNTDRYFKELVTDNTDQDRVNFLFPKTYEASSGGSVISDTQTIDSPKWNDFASDDGAINILNNSVVVNDKLFVNWYADGLFDNLDGNFDDRSEIKEHMEEEHEPDINNDWYIISSGKKCLLFGCNDLQVGTSSIDNLLPITIANVVNNNVNPYGGNSYFAKLNCVFYSFGDYGEITGDDENYINVYSGDCSIACFMYNSAHFWANNKYKSVVRDEVFYSVPIESSVDLLAVYGALFCHEGNKADAFMLQDIPCSINVGNYSYTQSESSYLYDSVYSTLPYLKHVAITYNELSTDNFDTRIVYSNEKINGEEIDNWLLFKSANFMDVDTRYGAITNLRLFKDYLVFWQESATGLLSVNERTVIQDANNNNIILGNGDVLQRYDYISTVYGMRKNQFCDAQSNTTLYWWDHNKKEILGYAGERSVIPMTKVKNVSTLVKTATLCNNPAVLYDDKNKEVWFSIIDNASLNYNENVQSFISLNNIPFSNYISYKNNLYLAYNNKMYYRSDTVSNANVLSHGTYDNALYPKIIYIVNKNPQYNKVFDTVVFGGKLYGGGNMYTSSDGENINIQNDSNVYHTTTYLEPINFTFTTNLKQTGKIINGEGITDREYDYRVNVPRQGKQVGSDWVTADYGDRLRGKIMQCEISSNSNSTDFSLQYITTKYRMSWS